MERVEGYDHRTGVHCGATAVRNVLEHYGLNYTEAAVFGIGGGPAFVAYAVPDRPWSTFRASPTWLERAVFERAGIPHAAREGDDFDTAWANVTSRIDENDPVILFLDPAGLDYLPAGQSHVPPHAVVAAGYDEEMVELGDPAVAERQRIPITSLEAAWTADRVVPLRNESLVLTRAGKTESGTDAAAAGLRQAGTYMVAPLSVKRDARGPGEEGIPALRSFGATIGSWADLDEPHEPVEAFLGSIDEHGDGTAYRRLFAESLTELGQRVNLPIELADRMERTASEWEAVATALDDVRAAEEPAPGRLEEAAAIVGDIADREAAIFGDLRAALGETEA